MLSESRQMYPLTNVYSGNLYLIMLGMLLFEQLYIIFCSYPEYFFYSKKQLCLMYCEFSITCLASVNSVGMQNGSLFRNA